MDERPRMAFFGRRYDAPIYEDAPGVATPVGVKCVWCEQPFTVGDDGFRYVSGEYTHRRCSLINLLGFDLAEEVLALEKEAS